MKGEKIGKEGKREKKKENTGPETSREWEGRRQEGRKEGDERREKENVKLVAIKTPVSCSEARENGN